MLEPDSPWKPWLHLVVVLTCLLVVPTIPFLILGDDFETWIEAWFSDQNSATWLSVTGFLLLAADIFLPVPSSVICTLLGARLGWWSGGLVGWLGLTLGCIIGYALAYTLGAPVARRLSRPSALQRAQQMSERYGMIALVVTRGIPIIGEAVVLAMGIYRLNPWRFGVSVAGVNLLLVFAYTLLGAWAKDQGWLPVAVGISAALPLLPLFFLRRTSHDPQKQSQPDELPDLE